MYTQFIYKNGSNPYIAKTGGELFRMLKKYDIENIGENTYTIQGEKTTPPRSYSEIKNIIREFAKDFNFNFNEFQYSYGELLFYQDFFETYGKRYGLLNEFRVNGIC